MSDKVGDDPCVSISGVDFRVFHSVRGRHCNMRGSNPKKEPTTSPKVSIEHNKN